MSFIKELMKEEIEDNNDRNDNCTMQPRYYPESFKICLLARYALNKPKNATKGAYEGISLERCLELLLLEVEELKEEIKKDEKNYERVLEELADVAGSVTGIYAKVRHTIRNPDPIQ
jgi:hypothetical protein